MRINSVGGIARVSWKYFNWFGLERVRKIEKKGRGGCSARRPRVRNLCFIVETRGELFRASDSGTGTRERKATAVISLVRETSDKLVPRLCLTKHYHPVAITFTFVRLWERN